MLLHTLQGTRLSPPQGIISPGHVQRGGREALLDSDLRVTVICVWHSQAVHAAGLSLLPGFQTLYTLQVSCDATGPTSCHLCWLLPNSTTPTQWLRPWTSPLCPVSLRPMPSNPCRHAGRLPWSYSSAPAPLVNSRFAEVKTSPLGHLWGSSNSAHPNRSS